MTERDFIFWPQGVVFDGKIPNKTEWKLICKNLQLVSPVIFLSERSEFLGLGIPETKSKMVINNKNPFEESTREEVKIIISG